MFRPDFMQWFEGLRLPAYHLEKHDGQYELTFEGKWPEVMLWEIPALAVLMELRSRAVLKGMGKFELQILYARAMSRLWEKIERLRQIDGLRIVPSAEESGTARSRRFPSRPRTLRRRRRRHCRWGRPRWPAACLRRTRRRPTPWRQCRGRHKCPGRR